MQLLNRPLVLANIKAPKRPAPTSKKEVKEREFTSILELDLDIDSSTPERVLLLATLARAQQDLAPWSPPRDRAEAIKWFTAGEVYYSHHFSFHQVAEELDLSANQLEVLQAYVDLAKSYQGRRKFKRSESLEVTKELNFKMRRRRVA